MKKPNIRASKLRKRKRSSASKPTKAQIAYRALGELRGRMLEYMQNVRMVINGTTGIRQGT